MNASKNTTASMLGTLRVLYSPAFPLLVVRVYAENTSLRAFWGWLLAGAPAGARGRTKPSGVYITAAAILLFLAYAQLLFGVGLIISEFQAAYAGGITFGIAMLLAIPFMTTLLTPLVTFIIRCAWQLARPKHLAKSLLCAVLEGQVVRLRKAHDLRVITVSGSVGKTSTKLAAAWLLESLGSKVQYQEGNYNDRLTVPLVVFGDTLPNLFNVFAWLRIIMRHERALGREYAYDTLVLELGTDGPGQMGDFAYLRPDLAIITSVAAEHMAQFGSLDAVAIEELEPLGYAKKVLINTSDVPARYLPAHGYIGYGAEQSSGYSVVTKQAGLAGQTLTVRKSTKQLFETKTKFLGDHGARIVLAAAATAHTLGYDATSIAAAVPALEPFAGRMRLLEGIEGAKLIDDSYNASPEAVRAALEVLQGSIAPQRVAILGSMNELGAESQSDHEALATVLDPKKLDLLVTIGLEANQYLAPAAVRQGIEVKTYENPRQAGEYVRSVLKPDALVLIKGSQNGVFAEEAIKPLLKNRADVEKLVRQSDGWMKAKRKQFQLP